MILCEYKYDVTVYTGYTDFVGQESVFISFPHCSCLLEAEMEMRMYSEIISHSDNQVNYFTLPDGRSFPCPNDIDSIKYYELEDSRIIGAMGNFNA